MNIEHKTVATLAFGIIFTLLLEYVSVVTIAYAQSGAGWKDR